MMSDIQVQQKDYFSTLGLSSGVQKTGENFVNRALNGLLDGILSKYGEARVRLGTAFTRYLKNATQRYNQVRTLATGTMPRSIIGTGSIYVSIGVRHKQKIVGTETVKSLLNISNNVLVLGTGGIGKSMLMRYLFLNTANRGEYVPVLLELRKVSNFSNKPLSLLDLIYSCMDDFDVDLPKDQFEDSLRLGKYIFLLDGFDEVKEAQAAETAEAIQAFCSKYPQNPCIITTRPGRDTSSLETFTAVQSIPLSKEQAVQLASKIWEEDEKTREFCRQLESVLYEKHKDFAENPLLLSMMFLTFMRNNSVPNHLAEFYGKAYDALYSAHDNNDKGYYRREFRCSTLDETEFKSLLSHFCFHTYFNEDYEFTEEQILGYLNKSIQKLGIMNVQAIDYLKDLRNVICILVEDGDIYRFAHRSFQTYFAACYTSKNLTDDQQKTLFASILTGSEVFWGKEDYYQLLAQMEPQRFAINALEKGLKNICEQISGNGNPDLCLFKLKYQALSINSQKNAERRGISFVISTRNETCQYYNYTALFRKLVKHIPYHQADANEWEFIRDCIDKVRAYHKLSDRTDLPFHIIDASKSISDDERACLYDTLVTVNKTAKVRIAMEEWLREVDEKRKTLESINFIDEL